MFCVANALRRWPARFLGAELEQLSIYFLLFFPTFVVTRPHCILVVVFHRVNQSVDGEGNRRRDGL